MDSWLKQAAPLSAALRPSTLLPWWLRRCGHAVTDVQGGTSGAGGTAVGSALRLVKVRASKTSTQTARRVSVRPKACSHAAEGKEPAVLCV